MSFPIHTSQITVWDSRDLCLLMCKPCSVDVNEPRYLPALVASGESSVYSSTVAGSLLGIRFAGPILEIAQPQVAVNVRH